MKLVGISSKEHAMIRTYLQIAIRNLSKDSFYSVINILGLTVGLGCFLLISLFIQHELSYDTHYANHENIYRIASKGAFGGSEFDIAVAGAPVGQAMMEDYPEVENFVRLRMDGVELFRSGDDYFKEEAIYVDGNFFEFFDQPVTKGNPKTALLKPNTCAISTSMAARVFDEEDPIGKVLEFTGGDKYEVTAVFEDTPANTHFHFDFLLSMESLQESKLKVWLSQNFHTYLLLTDGTDAKEFQRKMQGMIPKYMGPEVERFLGKSLSEFEAEGNSIAFYLQPVKEIHLRSNLVAELEANSDIRYVYIFSAIAVFILVIASINYMNLATARSSGRAKEVGIRKVMGAYRPQLMLQFISESVIIAVIATVLSILAAYWSLPYFNELAGKNFDGSIFESNAVIGMMLLIALIIGILSGSYPAFFLSAFQPANVLKGKLSGAKNGRMRNILVVFQFSISIFLMVGTMVIFDQLTFIRNSDLGFDKEHKIILYNTSSLGESVRAFKEEVLSNSNFEAATITSYLPSPSSRNQSAVFRGNDPSDGSVSMQIWVVDHDFLKTMDMEVVEGRDFSKDLPSDSTAVLINQSAQKQLALNTPLGEKVSFYMGRRDQEGFIASTFNVVGVVKDFNFTSLRENITPLIMIMGNSPGIITFKLSTDDYHEALATLESKWEEFAPGYPFEYTFLDDALVEVYAGDDQVGKILASFALIAIFIACLGLFALSSFTAEQRSKEIGIRKVLGASVSGIMTLLSREFIKLMGIAFILAAPLSYLAMNFWLDDFAYRTPIQVTTFILAGLGSFGIAWLTMSYQSLRAAKSNPVNTLRDE